jgi:tetratricopeptide (TPR) repeat protein
MSQPAPAPARALLAAAALAAFATAAPLAAQAPPDAADPELARALAAVQTCAALAESRQAGEARTAGQTAEALLARYLERHPRDVAALVGMARAASQCLLPAADLAGQGELSARALELLDQALALEPTHWTARYVLASICFRSPAFVGRGPRAARELDALLRQQGDRADVPAFARPYELRGLLWMRTGQPDSARAVWRRGAALFPADTALQRLAAPPASVGIPATPAPASLRTLRVVASSAPPAVGARAPSVRTVSRSEVLMTAGGGADVLQAVQLLPGATRVTEGSDVHTRGGDASETALLVDGGRLPALGRHEGLSGSLFGALDPFVVRAVRYSSGGFTARHGNALSGVLEIETDGRPRERQLRAGASLVQLGGTARVPLGARVGGWVSGRASHTGALLATHGRTGEFDGAPHSQEVVASLVASPTPLTELRATALVERDDSRRLVDAAGWRGAFHSAGALRAAQLSGRWVSARAPVVVRANLTGSTRSSDWDFGVLAREREDASLAARVDAEWARSSAMTLRAGVERAALSRDERGALPTTGVVAPGAPSRDVAEHARARHVGGYVETELAAGGATVTTGLRADRLPGEAALTLDPRIAVSARRGAWTARVGGGVFHQGRFRAAPAIPDAGTPSGAARTARHLVAGVEHAGPAATLRVEAYDKAYGDYVAHGAGPAIASGRARGLELIAQRTAGGPLTGWVGYSLLDATVRLHDGRRARSPFDATHSATASAAWAMHADWSLGSTFRYGTGTPVTPVVGTVRPPDGRIAPVYGAPGAERLPDYARLDVRLTRFVRAPAFLLTAYVEAFNVAGRRNVASLAYDAEYRVRRPVHAFFAARTLVAGGELQFR